MPPKRTMGMGPRGGAVEELDEFTKMSAQEL